MPASPPLTDAILTGDFRSGRGYGTQRPRGSGDYLLILTVAGAGALRGATGGAEGGRVVVGPGDLTIYRPGTPQDYYTDEGAKRWHLLWAHFQPRPHWGPYLRLPEAFPGLMHLRLSGSVYDGVRRALTAMHAAALATGAYATDLALLHLEHALILSCREVAVPGRPVVDGRVSSLLRDLTELAEEAGPLDLEELAGGVSLSVSRLQHLFRAQTGQTLHEFYERQRVERAKRLLLGTNLSVKEVAGACGFNSPFYFSLRFKRATGKSPALWRAST